MEKNGQDTWKDPSKYKIEMLKEENQWLRNKLEKLECQLADSWKEESSSPETSMFDLHLCCIVIIIIGTCNNESTKVQNARR